LWLLALASLNPIPSLLILWGGLVTALVVWNLVEGAQAMRVAWAALATAAYAALAVPTLVGGTWKLVEAIGPVTALTFAAHLPRRDVARALRDWALVMGVALYWALGMLAMWQIVSSFGAGAFSLGVLLPPLVLEGVAIALKRTGIAKGWRTAQVTGLVVATAASIAALAATLLNRSTPFLWSVVFDVAAGALIGGALFLGLITRPMIEAASGAYRTGTGGVSLQRALVELSHGPVLIALALYIPLRLLNMAT
jgi:hypothetical protein